ncbi:MAG: hypothetical protein [Microviridae sp.]|nr:MAG: hypothetical protein [Microviridae sp.]
MKNSSGLTENGKQSKLKDTNIYAKENQHRENSSELVQGLEHIEDSPFMLVTTIEGSFLALGEHRVTELMDKEDAKKMVTEKSWALIGALFTVMQTKLNNQLKQTT